MKYLKLYLIPAFIFLQPLYAYSYIGPGAGLTAIGSVLAFIILILMLIVSYLYYPIKRFLKNKKHSSTHGLHGNESVDTDQCSGLP